MIQSHSFICESIFPPTPNEVSFDRDFAINVYVMDTVSKHMYKLLEVFIMSLGKFVLKLLG